MRSSRLLSSVFLLACLGAPAHAAVVESLHAEQAADHTRLVFQLDAALEHRIFTLENPHRVVIDLQGARLKTDLDQVALDATPVARVRSAPRNETDLRVVFDLREPVQPRSFLLAGNGAQG